MPKKNITPQKRAAATLLAQGVRHTDVCAQLNLNMATVSVWKRDPEFCAVIEEAQQAVIAVAQAKMKSVADKMVTVLEEIANDEDAKPSDRIKAANSILDRIGLHRPTTTTTVNVQAPEHADAILNLLRESDPE